MYPSVRVYLLCYNRNEMLPRALRSLINQTYTNWVCELHCDKPDNDFPEQLVKKENDPRVVYVHHEKNLGLTNAFNLAFRKVSENYISILEEDNWWEPDFLEQMVEEMERNPDCSMGWANMRTWNLGKENWIDTKKNIWDLQHENNIRFYFPHIQQIKSALHSQGCMLVRMLPYNPNLVIPFDFDSGALEGIRERAFTYPIIFINKQLGNIAMLDETHRSLKRHVWAAITICLTISFFKNVKADKRLLKNILHKSRQGRVKTIHTLLLAKIVDRGISISFFDFKINDFIFFIGYYLKNFNELRLVLRDYHTLNELTAWLNVNTPKAFLENKEYETCQ